MSLRTMTAQYIGGTLFLPKLEREVKHIIVKDENVKDWKHFELERTCQDVNEEEDDFTCSACGASMFTQIDDIWVMIAQDGEDDDLIEQPHYCPNCGARVIGHE